MRGADIAGSIVGLAVFIYLTVDAWRSPGTTGQKILWTLFAFICWPVALIVWLVTGRKRMYGGSATPAM